jgi:hypothetical protein
MDLVEIEWVGADWINLAHDRDPWRALVNAVITFGFHKMLGNYRMAAQLVTSRMCSAK